MEAETYRENLEANLNSLVSDVVEADTCIQVLKVIGEKADAINANNYGDLFRFLQGVLSNELNLALTRLFEPEGEKYPLRSIPSSLAMLEEGLCILPLGQKPSVISELVKMGVPSQELEGLDDEALKAKMIEVFRTKLPDVQKVELCNLSRMLAAWKKTRDKTIAHREALGPDENMPDRSFEQANALLDYAKHFISAVGWGFFNVAYTAEEHYLLTDDTERIARALRRLLRSARSRP